MAPLPLAVSMGDPCGIGPEIILKIWNERKQLELPSMVIIGDGSFLKERAKLLGFTDNIKQISSPSDLCPDSLCVIDYGHNVDGKPGSPTLSDAKATIRAIEIAVELVFKKQCSGLVTSPINKEALYQAGFEHPGHTEFLAELANQHTGTRHLPVMMIAGPELRTVPVTIHIPVAEISAALTEELIVRTIEVINQDLSSRFGIERPRIAVAGLNPHAGENGSIGTEDIRTIVPAIGKLQEKHLNIVGPLPADTMFHASARSRYDVAVCMYHDQALIPAKMLGFEDGVNVTLGLPFIRTSPDHGTAYDIAGTGQADIQSFVAALKMAAEMAEKS